MRTLDVPAIKKKEDIVNLQPTALECYNWESYPDGPNTWFKIGRTADRIVILYHVDEENPRAVGEKDFDNVWEDSCVEFFCKLPMSNRYFNFEFNSKGVALASSRISRNEGMVRVPDEQMAEITREPRIEPHYWELLVTIPYSIIGYGKDGGNILNANFYKCGDLTDEPHFISWNPISTESPDFHRPEFFGQLVL